MDSYLQQAEHSISSDYKKFRWALGVSGALSVALGVVILIWPSISLFALTILVGAYMVANGVVGLYVVIRQKTMSQRGWLSFLSLLSIVAGVLVLVWPGIGALSLLYVIGIYAIAFGVFMSGAAFALPLDGGDRALTLFSGLVAILFGIVMFARPGAGALVTLALIAAFLLIMGVSELVLAIGGKRLMESRFQHVLKQAEAQLKQNEPQPSSS